MEDNSEITINPEVWTQYFGGDGRSGAQRRDHSGSSREERPATRYLDDYRDSLKALDACVPLCK